jgi:hypothetical protein
VKQHIKKVIKTHPQHLLYIFMFYVKATILSNA